MPPGEHHSPSEGASSESRPHPPLAPECVATICLLPDYVLLRIFDLYRGTNEYFTPETWNPLAHVCRRWRELLFASPRRLRLLLVCDVKVPVKKLLDIWPTFPIGISYRAKDKNDEQNVIAALGYNCHISLVAFKDLTSPVLERFSAAMQKPFPGLMYIRLESLDEVGPVIPESFLGGSAPQLQSLLLTGIAFPAFPKLIISSPHVTKLWLQRIPDTWHIESEVMVTCLNALPKLEELHIGFLSPRSHPFQTRFPPTRTILPALMYLWFRGDSNYLEDLITNFEVPNLESLHLSFFGRHTFAIPQLHNFISSAEKLRQLKRAHIRLYPLSVKITLGLLTILDLEFSFDVLGRQVSWMAQLCNAYSHLLSHVERLEIHGKDSRAEVQEDMEDMQWQELLRPFTAVQALYLSRKLWPLFLHTLQEIGRERAIEMLPALHSLFLGGLIPPEVVKEIIQPFIAARQHSGCPVVVERWDRDWYRDDGMEDVEGGDG